MRIAGGFMGADQPASACKVRAIDHTKAQRASQDCALGLLLWIVETDAGITAYQEHTQAKAAALRDKSKPAGPGKG